MMMSMIFAAIWNIDSKKDMTGCVVWTGNNVIEIARITAKNIV